ncbi:MAG: asparaginase domain-containing protein [Candidatus Limnocylindrales bacterium]
MTPQRIAILGTGGTIGNTTAGRLPIARLVDEIAAHEAALDPAGLVVEEARRVAGSEIAPADWLAIRAQAIGLLDRPEVGGLVITHGTFTVEETAWFLHLTLSSEKPVVVTCAQRKHGQLGNDGDRNLVDAVAVAASGATAGTGVVVAVGQEIHSAREVVKLSVHPNGFGSRDLGLLGSLDADEVTIYRQPRRRHTAGSEFAALPLDVDLPRVDVVATYAGADGVAIEACVAAGAAGLVLEGFPYSGKPTRAQAEALARAAERGVAVAVANRGIHGRVPAAQAEGGIGADSLTATKARVLLMLALAAGRGGELARIFAEY